MLPMPYLRRDADGSITSLHRRAEPEAADFLPDDDAEVQAFVGNEGMDQRFARLDAGFIRVLEDLIDVLIRAKVMNLTDLPVEAQRKLNSRKDQRRPSALSELNLLGDGTGLDEVFSALPARSSGA